MEESLMKPFHIVAKTISDAWFQLVYAIMDDENIYRQGIQRGSFENEQTRRQFPGASIYIEHPDKDIIPVFPPGLGIPPVTTREYIDDYYARYIVSGLIEGDEDYTYGSRILAESSKRLPPEWPGVEPSVRRSQISWLIDMLSRTPLTNQAVIEIATPYDITLKDPPCLRLIDFKVIPMDGKLVLTVSVYFRSWDLWAGLPSNLGAIEQLKSDIAEHTGLVNGPMYAYSAGLHIYGYQEELARIRTMKNKSASDK